MGESEKPDGVGGLPRLPPGRHGLPPEFVAQNQRDRIAAGMIKAVSELGYHDTTVTDIASAAGLSRRTFYSFYKSKSDCFAATYEMVGEFLLAAMGEAGEVERGWPARVRAELETMLEVFAANPDLARFALIAPPEAGGEIAAAYRELLERLLGTFAAGRPKSARRASGGAEHGLVGGLAALVVDKVRAGEGAEIPELLPDLVELVLTPYLGRERAVREARD